MKAGDFHYNIHSHLSDTSLTPRTARGSSKPGDSGARRCTSQHCRTDPLASNREAPELDSTLSSPSSRTAVD